MLAEIHDGICNCVQLKSIKFHITYFKELFDRSDCAITVEFHVGDASLQF